MAPLVGLIAGDAGVRLQCACNEREGSVRFTCRFRSIAAGLRTRSAMYCLNRVEVTDAKFQSANPVSDVRFAGFR